VKGKGFNAGGVSNYWPEDFVNVSVKSDIKPARGGGNLLSKMHWGARIWKSAQKRGGGVKKKGGEKARPKAPV